MKKIICLAFLTAIICVLTACGCNNDKAASNLGSDVTDAMSDAKSNITQAATDIQSNIIDSVSDMTGGHISDNDGVIGNEAEESSLQNSTQTDITM